MTGRIIESPACVAEGAEWLAAREPRFARALKRTGPLPLRRRPEGFSALLEIIVGQQVSTAAARAIWDRLQVAGLTGEAAVARAGDEALRGCGLSRPKVRYARALACARLPYPQLSAAPADEVLAVLTAQPGIGSWSAEIYVLFSLGRADAFAAGDLALQEAARLIFELPERPSERALRGMAEAWSPWRGVAARLLWAYYRVEKSREGIT